jgi:pimeloyl-ACP methyl ester carboxylesterase
MPKALINGLNIHYQQVGRGPDVVLVHGITGPLAYWWVRTVPLLKDEYRVTTYDLRGHGLSDMPPDGYTSADMADDLIHLLNYLEIPKARLVGHSFGGPIALHTALRHPERVADVVVVDSDVPALHHLNQRQDWAYFEAHKAWLADTLGLVIPDDKWDDLHYIFERTLEVPITFGMRKGHKRDTGRGRLLRLLNETTACADLSAVAGLTAEAITRITSPTLLLYGERTRFMGTFNFLKDNLPNARAWLVPNRGHQLPLVRPATFINSVKAFWRNPHAFDELGRDEELLEAALPAVVDAAWYA